MLRWFGHNMTILQDERKPGTMLQKCELVLVVVAVVDLLERSL